MLAAMCGAVFLKQAAAIEQRSAELRISCDHSKRSLPGALRHDGKRNASASVIRAQHNAALRDFDSRVNGTSNVSGINVACVRRNASNCAHASHFSCEGEFANLPFQFVGAPRIESARDSRSSYRTYSGSHVDLLSETQRAGLQFYDALK